MSRIPYVEKEDLDEDLRQLVESHTVRPGEPLHIRQALANNPELLQAFHEYGSTIREENGLSTRQRELVILTVAHHLRSKYIWHQHVLFAHDGVLSAGDLRALSNGENGPLSSEETSLVQYTRRFTSGDVTDEVHHELSQYFSPPDIVGIGLLIMNYLALAHGIAGFDIDIEHEEFVGWDLENL